MLRFITFTASKHQLLQVACCQTLMRPAVSTRPGNKSNESDFCIQPVEEKDMVGPPDPVSNIRPILIHIPATETKIEKRYRLQRESIQKWNQEFWTTHNTRFIKERDQFVKKAKDINSNKDGQQQPLTADEMSIFYKKFLDSNWLTHVTYNKEWYKKNIGLMLLSLQVEISRSFESLKQRFKTNQTK